MGPPIAASPAFNFEACVQRLHNEKADGEESEAELEDVDAEAVTQQACWVQPVNATSSTNIDSPASASTKAQKLKAGSKRRRQQKRAHANLDETTPLKGITKHQRTNASVTTLRTKLNVADDLQRSKLGWIGSRSAEEEHHVGEYTDDLQDLLREGSGFRLVDWDGKPVSPGDLLSCLTLFI